MIPGVVHSKDKRYCIKLDKSECHEIFEFGLVVPGAGLAFLNESIYNWYVAKTGYQVLTCPESMETTTIPIEETTTTEVEETTVIGTTTAINDHFCGK